MFVLALVALGLILGLGFTLVLGRRPRGVLGVALAGCAVWSGVSLYAIVAGCAWGEECTPTRSVLIPGFVLIGWLLGVGLAAVVLQQHGFVRRTGVLVVGLGLLATTAAVVYQHYGFQLAMWGCPTTGELNRTQSVERVIGAFEDHDLPLEPIPLPVWMPRDEPAYRGARAFRYATPDATAYVIVCRGRCAISRSRFAEQRTLAEQRWYMALIPGNNVPILVTEAGRGDGLRLLEALGPARREVQPYSRCNVIR